LEAYIPAIATVVVALLRALWFNENTAARDRILPILVLVANFLGQVIAGLGDPVNPGGIVAASAGGTVVSLGLHRVLRWLKDLILSKLRK